MRVITQALLVALCIGLGLAGCNRLSPVPEFKNVAITPRDLRPGDTAVITVELDDKNNIVDRVEGILREAPQITFRLQDDGQPPDEKAADDVWTLPVDVPWDAPPGEFIMEITAYRSDGVAVPVRDKEGNTVPLMVTYPFAVQYSAEVVAPDAAPVEGTPVEAPPADSAPAEVPPAE